MNDSMKLAVGVVAGIVVAVACVFGVEMIGHSLYPPPPGLDLTKPEDMARLMEMVPAAALAFVAAAWFIGSLLGAWVANLIAKRSLAGWIVALAVIAAGVFTMTQIPHPAWLWACGILLPLLGAQLAQMLTRTPATRP